jgi:aldose 1-epimerase
MNRREHIMKTCRPVGFERSVVTVLGLAAAVLAVAPAQAATVTRAVFGTSADGEVVEQISLVNDHGMTVRFLTRGGAFTEIDVPDRNGKIANVVLGLPDFAAWDRGGAFNSVVGRYANRIDHGGFTLDGTFYKLAGVNPKTQVAMHGGPHGFGSRLWKAETFDHGDSVGAVLSYVSADGENGYPGALSVTMTYTLTSDDVLRLDYRATTTKPTVVNLTNHTYFNIGGYASGPVYDQLLQVFASHWTPTDARQIPTGEIASVAGTPFDFRKPVRVGDRVYSTDPQMMLAKGLDHNFVLDKPADGALSVAVRLHDPKSGRQLEVRTTEPGVQVYSANNFNGSMAGANGRTLRQGDGLAFETEHFPDSPNKPNFPSTVLRPGQQFHSITEFAFSTDAHPFP